MLFRCGLAVPIETLHGVWLCMGSSIEYPFPFSFSESVNFSGVIKTDLGCCHPFLTIDKSGFDNTQFHSNCLGLREYILYPIAVLMLCKRIMQLLCM